MGQRGSDGVPRTCPAVDRRRRRKADTCVSIRAVVPTTVVLLVLASALVHASWNALLKREPDTEGAAGAFLLVCTAVAVAVACLERRTAFPTRAGLGWALGSGVFEGLYFSTLSIALARAPLGPVYTVSRGGALLAVWPLSIALLGERVTPLGATGAGLILVGLGATGAGRQAVGAARGALGWASACALCIAGYHIGYKYALGAGASPAATFAVSLVVGLPINLVRFGRRALSRPLAAWRGRPLVVTLAGSLAALSFLAFMFALARGGAGAVLTLRNTSVVFANAMAWALGERPGRVVIAGAVLVTVGAVLLGWS